MYKKKKYGRKKKWKSMQECERKRNAMRESLR